VSSSRAWDRDLPGLLPESAPGLTRLVLQLEEQRAVEEVRRDPHDLGISPSHHLGVDHGVADPHVGEQPLVLIAPFAVQLQPDVLAGDELDVDPPRRVAGRRGVGKVSGPRPGLRGMRVAPGMRDLRSIDADVADLLHAVIEPHVDGVAVDHVDDRAF